jgi:alanine dehydrogenase
VRIGVPTEIKDNEFRVGLTPAAVKELTTAGHELLVQSGAGAGIAITDDHYRTAGATIIPTAAELFARAEMIIKVKEPQPSEIRMLRKQQILFTFLHLAPDPEQTQGLLDSGVSAIAYETVTDDHEQLPLLKPMSEVAGRMAIQAGARCLEKSVGGAGRLLGGVTGVAPARVVVIGGGIVGTNAIRMALGLEAHVTVLDRSLEQLARLDQQFGGRLNTIFSGAATLEEYVVKADLVIGAVLVPGARAPKLVTREMVSRMRPGSVMVDVAIDQGGCFETSQPTTHAAPTYIVDKVVHYCVTNMPGAVAHTSTYALNNATLPFVQALANKGLRKALQDDKHLMSGLNIHHGHVTNAAVAQSQSRPFQLASALLSED